MFKPFSSEVKLFGKVLSIYERGNGKALRLWFKDSRNESHFVNANCMGFVAKDLEDNKIKKGDSIEIFGELTSYDKTIDGKSITLHSIYVNKLNLVNKVNQSF